MQVTTSANQSPGASLVTHGGNGGNGGSAGVGGGGKNGGGGASGGLVQFNANSSWNVLTRGVQSPGISALSLGGTGGRGSDGSFFNPSPGSGGSTADGQPVTIGLGGPIKGTIQTFGPESPAMVFQSVTGHAGGGGGSGGVVGFGAAGGSAGTGGAVAVNSGIQVNTGSDQSPGLVAQSIGGGGGNGGSGFGIFYGRGGGGSLGGRGGAVTVVNTGDIVTGGEGFAWPGSAEHRWHGWRRWRCGSTRGPGRRQFQHLEWWPGQRDQFRG